MPPFTPLLPSRTLCTLRTRGHRTSLRTVHYPFIYLSRISSTHSQAKLPVFIAYALRHRTKLHHLLWPRGHRTSLRSVHYPFIYFSQPPSTHAYARLPIISKCRRPPLLPSQTPFTDMSTSYVSALRSLPIYLLVPNTIDGFLGHRTMLHPSVTFAALVLLQRFKARTRPHKY